MGTCLLSRASALSLDTSTSNLYVLDNSSMIIHSFNSTGNHLRLYPGMVRVRVPS